MKTLYLDIFSGLSGDMFLGAMIDLGVDVHALEHELEKLRLDGWHLHVSRQQRSHIAGVKLEVHLDHDPDHDDEHQHEDHEHGHAHAHGHSHPHAHEHSHEEHGHGRSHADIQQLIRSSGLSEWVTTKSLAVFQRIAVAEGKIHGQPPGQVHFHEVGAIDSIVDIVGACAALEQLGRPRVLAGLVIEGTGWVKCAHGKFPLPAPATLEILGARGVPVSQCDEPNELITPTGAAILAEFAETFGPMRGLAVGRIGYGLGSRENQTRPNVVRAVLGVSSAATAGHDWETDTVAVLQTNLDDVNAEVLGRFLGLALARGALDVFHTPIQMKKNRPGVLLTVLCAEGEADAFAELLLRETTAFGVRRHVAERRKLRRETITVQTPYGPLPVKLGRLDGQLVQAAPEFDACERLAEQTGVPLKRIYEAALRVTPV